VTFPETVLVDTPRAYYRFEEQSGDDSYLDSSGNGLHIAGGPSSSNEIDGGFDWWSEASRKSDVALVAPFTTTGVHGFAYEILFRATTQADYFLGGVDASGIHSVGVRTEISETAAGSGTWVLKFGMGLGPSWDFTTSSGRVSVLSDSVNSIFDGLWHHIVVSWAGTAGLAANADQLSIWIDGVQRDVSGTRYTNSGGGWFPTPNLSLDGQWLIGGPFDGGSNAETAWYDEAAIYEHALSSSRVVAHFNALPSLSTTYVASSVGEIIPLGPIGPVGTTTTLFDLTVPTAFGLSIFGTSLVQIDGGVVPADAFAFRDVLAPSGSLTVNLTDCALETGEPNAAGYSKTAWFEIPFDYDFTETARIALTSLTSTGKVSVYKSTLASVDDDEDDDPAAITSLSLVQTASADQHFTLDADYGQSYYVQVGLLTGTGADFTLTWGDADPAEGGTFATALDVGGTSGFERATVVNGWLETSEPIPAGLAAIRSAWLVWEADNPAAVSQTFTVNTDDDSEFAVTVYSGTTLGTLVQEATSGVVTDEGKVSVVPADGGTYYVQIASEGELGEYEIEWAGPAAEVDPADVVQHLRVEVYDASGTVLITEVPNREGSQFADSLNVATSASLTIHQHDPVVAAYATADDPWDLFRFGNIVKFWMGTKCVSGFVIKSRDVGVVSDSEEVGKTLTVSGPTVHFVLDNFMITQDARLSEYSSATRTYSWASMPGEWYQASKWDDHINANKMSDPPGGKKGQSAKKRPKYSLYARKKNKWPDKQALWMWISQQSSQNEGHWKPKRKIKGLHYYRTEVNVLHGGKTWRMSVAADDYYEIWLDGELVLGGDGSEAYRVFRQKTVTLSKGSHTIAAFVRDKGKVKSGDRNDAFLFTLQQINKKGKVQSTIKRSGKQWAAWHGPNPPGWNRAMILRNAVIEARERNNDTALGLTLGFTKDTDSDGNKWRDDTNADVQVGTSVLDLQSQFSESNEFDVWIDAGSMTLNASRRRGRNKSDSVVLAPGYNLLVWSVSETDEMKNVILAQHAAGFVWVRSPSSVRKYGAREAYLEFGGLRSDAAVEALVTALLSSVSRAGISGGSPAIVNHKEESYSGSVIAVAGAVPFLDYEVGDIVSAPGSDGGLRAHRVLSITGTEDGDGQLTFDPELEAV
jgi:hypothetical protein